MERFLSIGMISCWLGIKIHVNIFGINIKLFGIKVIRIGYQIRKVPYQICSCMFGMLYIFMDTHLLPCNIDCILKGLYQEKRIKCLNLIWISFSRVWHIYRQMFNSYQIQSFGYWYDFLFAGYKNIIKIPRYRYQSLWYKCHLSCIPKNRCFIQNTPLIVFVGNIEWWV